MRRAALLCVVLVLTGCTRENEAMQPTMTQADARARVEQMVSEARTAMGGAELRAGPLGPVPCDDPTDDGPAGRVFIENGYEIVDAQRVNPFPAMRELFAGKGFRVRRDESDYLSAENPADGFRVVVEANRVGNVYLTVSSPCVWPDGTPSPG